MNEREHHGRNGGIMDKWKHHGRNGGIMDKMGASWSIMDKREALEIFLTIEVIYYLFLLFFASLK